VIKLKDDGTGEACSTYMIEEMCIEGFGKETWRKDAIRGTSSRGEDNIKMDHQEIQKNGIDWIDLSEGRVK
jgi:hypothetical protein